MTHRLSKKIETWIDDAVEAKRLGDEVTWDGAFTMTPEGPKFLVAFFLPGALLGTMVQSVSIIDNVVMATSEDIDGMVAHTLEDLRKNRTQQMSIDAGANLGQMNGSPLAGG